MRKLWIVVFTAGAVCALALGTAPEAAAAPQAAAGSVCHGISIGFGFGGHCAPPPVYAPYVHRTYYYGYGYGHPTYVYRPYHVVRPHYYGHHHGHHHLHHHGHYRGHHHGHHHRHAGPRAIGRRR